MITLEEIIAQLAEISKNRSLKITLALGPNWQGLYINGRLVEQGINLHPVDILKWIPSRMVRIKSSYFESDAGKVGLPPSEDDLEDLIGT